MSDTPRTDQQAREWYAGVLMPSDLIALARELERENAALRAAIDESEEFARKDGETARAKIGELLRENAALREQVRCLKQDLSITRQLRCHQIVESEKQEQP